MLNFQEAPLAVVIASLAEQAGMNVSYSGLPSRPVTLRSSTPVPRAELRKMLQSVVQANGLVLVEEGGLARISTPEPTARPGQTGPVAVSPVSTSPVAEGGGVRLYVYRLRHSRAEQVAQTLRELFGLAARSGEGGLPTDRGLAARDVRRDRVPNPLAPPTEIPPPRAVSPPLTGAAGPGMAAQLRGTVQVVPDPLTNTLFIRGEPQDYQIIQTAIQEMDVRPLQVLIEVLIAEVGRDRQLDLGLTATVPDQPHPETGAILGGELKGNSPGGLALRILGVGAVKADVVLRALSSSSRVTVLSRPIVLAQNNQEARILVGDQRPFVQISRALPTDAAVRDQVIQYRDVGTQLHITPTINPDGYVTLLVQQEVSDATNESQFNAPIIRTREVETQLFVKDGHTAVIGGLVQQRRETGNSGVPVLRDIPLIGNLFRSTKRGSAATEMFLLLTPHVIRTDDDLDNMTEELKDSTHDLRNEIPDPAPLVERVESARRRRRP